MGLCCQSTIEFSELLQLSVKKYSPFHSYKQITSISDLSYIVFTLISVALNKRLPPLSAAFGTEK